MNQKISHRMKFLVLSLDEVYFHKIMSTSGELFEIIRNENARKRPHVAFCHLYIFSGFSSYKKTVCDILLLKVTSREFNKVVFRVCWLNELDKPCQFCVDCVLTCLHKYLPFIVLLNCVEIC